MNTSLENLRPMSVQDMLDVGFRLFRSNFWLLISTYAILYLPINLLLAVITTYVFQNAMNTAMNTPATVGPAILLQYALQLVNLALQGIACGATVKAVAATYLNEKIDLRSAYDFVLPKTVPLLVTLVLFYLVLIAGTVMCIIPGFVFGIWFAFVTQVVVLENHGYFTALRRSKELVQGYFWKVAGALFLTMLLGYVVMGVITFPGGMLMGINMFTTVMHGGAPSSMSPWSMAVMMGTSLIANLLFYPFLGIMVTLVYYDLRIRKEGFDLELMAREAGYGGSVAQQADAQVSG